MKVAIVAIIRDEASDILAWLGWHIALGVDTFVLFDDGSCDGTRDLILDAAILHDIRIYVIENAIDSHIERQKAAYVTALNGLEDGFDWIGFLDADEYLQLDDTSRIQDFLASFPEDVSAIGINWCNYGSSGHVLKPAMPAFHAFTHHYTSENAVNRHVKSFIRPRLWSGNWENVHFFSMSEGRYVSPDGQDILWSDVNGITEHHPVWARARILHYQLRSMEHFVERTRRRLDITLTPNQFCHADHNDCHDPRPRERTPAVLSWMRSAVRQGVARVLNARPSTMTPDLASVLPDIPALRVFVASPMEGGHLRVVGDDVRLVSDDAEDQAFLALQIGAQSDLLFLFPAGLSGQILDGIIEEDSHLLGFFPYKPISSDKAGSVALQRPGHQFFLTAIPVPHGGNVAANRRNIQDWELFSLQPGEGNKIADRVLAGRTFEFLRVGLSTPINGATLSRLAIADIDQTIRCLPILMSLMHEDDLAALRQALGPLLRYVF